MPVLFVWTATVPAAAASVTRQAAVSQTSRFLEPENPAVHGQTSTLDSLAGANIDTIRTSYNAQGLQREVFGFAPYWALSQQNQWNFGLMSTVAYFAIKLSWDGTWYQAGGGWQGFFSQDLVNMIDKAHANGDRTVLVVSTGGTASINDIVTVPSISQLAISNILGAVGDRGFDGVNIDFEGDGPSSTYPNIQTGLTSFMGQLTAAMHQQWPSSQVSIDTYSGSASWDSGLFRIDTLAPNVDAFFIMAYDMSFSNMPGQAGPNAPMTGWTYNDSLSVSQYLSKAPASKIILGAPWYAYRFKTSSNTPYASTTSAIAEPYSQAMGDLSCAKPAVRWDSTAQSYWAVWYSPASGDPCGYNAGSWLELYFDESQSLGVKYNLVNSSGIRGTGIWALGYDGGLSAVWSTLSTYFSCPASAALGASQSTTEFTISITTGTCSVAYDEVQQFDDTTNTGWYPLSNVVPTGGIANAVVEGFPGHSYEFRVRAHSVAGVVSAWATISTTVAIGATYSHPYKGLYTIDAYGGVNRDGSPPLSGSAYWAGKKIARAGHALPGANPDAGAVLDGYGNLHSYGMPMTLTVSAYWPGWDVARDFAFLPDGSGGYVLDAFGGLHPFSINGKPMPPATAIDAYWPNWYIAKRVVIFSDGTGGYVLDGYGGVHPFGIGGARPPAVQLSAYWGWNIARDLALIPGTHSGYVLDGYGNLHPFTPQGQAMPPSLAASAVWWGWDIARGLVILSGSTASAPGGYVLDGYGGLHQFGNAPKPPAYAYWVGQDIARTIAGY